VACWHWRCSLKWVCCNFSMKRTRQDVPHCTMQVVRDTSAVWKTSSGLGPVSTSRTITMRALCTLQPGKGYHSNEIFGLTCSKKFWQIVIILIGHDKHFGFYRLLLFCESWCCLYIKTPLKMSFFLIFTHSKNLQFLPLCQSY